MTRPQRPRPQRLVSTIERRARVRGPAARLRGTAQRWSTGIHRSDPTCSKLLESESRRNFSSNTTRRRTSAAAPRRAAEWRTSPASTHPSPCSPCTSGLRRRTWQRTGRPRSRPLRCSSRHRCQAHMHSRLVSGSGRPHLSAGLPRRRGRPRLPAPRARPPDLPSPLRRARAGRRRRPVRSLRLRSLRCEWWRCCLNPPAIHPSSTRLARRSARKLPRIRLQ